MGLELYSKVEEYLCTGLHVLVNERIEEVVELITKKAEVVNPYIFDEKNRYDRAKHYQLLFNKEFVKNKYNSIYKVLSHG